MTSFYAKIFLNIYVINTNINLYEKDMYFKRYSNLEKSCIYTKITKIVEMNQKFSKKCFLLFIYHLHFVRPVSPKFIFLSKSLTQTDFYF